MVVDSDCSCLCFLRNGTENVSEVIKSVLLINLKNLTQPLWTIPAAASLEVMPVGIVVFLVGMIVGCLVGGFLLALVAANRINNDEIPDDTDREGWE